MIGILHAYSRENRGDALLAEITVARISRLFPDETIFMVAHDPQSFSDLNVMTFPAVPTRARHQLKSIGEAISGINQTVKTTAHISTPLGELLRECQLVVSVGGAFLRGNTVRSSASMVGVHLPQLIQAAHYSANRTVYLPQSIGPFLSAARPVIQKSLSKLNMVYLRDDKSMLQLSTLDNTARMSDLAILELCETDSTVRSPNYSDHILLVGRFTSAQGSSRFARLTQELPQSLIAIQSTAGRFDDRSFYRSIDIEPHGYYPELVSSNHIGLVVSIRLHASLEAVLNGIPTIHLAYERKGFGAMRDLGLERYVHSANTFDPLAVARQANEILSNPEIYWAQLEQSRLKLHTANLQLNQRLQDVYGN